MEKPQWCEGACPKGSLVPPSEGCYFSGLLWAKHQLGLSYLAPACMEIPGRETPFLIIGGRTALGQRPRNFCQSPRQTPLGRSGAERRLGEPSGGGVR